MAFPGGIELDHVFVFVSGDEAEGDRLRALGLVETYRREHRGQGTRNVCYAFDNIFLELLWIDDAVAARSEAIARTKLFERSRWATDATCRFGIAWREGGPDATSGLRTWDFSPPYLPKGMTIPVAIESDDPRQPMMFRSPGTTPPSEWPIARRGDLQRGAGLSVVSAVTLRLPKSLAPSSALRSLAARDLVRIASNDDETYALDLEIERASGPALQLGF